MTDFLDQAVVLPIVAAVAILLAAQGWRRGALAWLGVVGITFGVILLLKLGFLACGPVFGQWDLRSPSGHTAAASMIGGGLVTFLAGSPMTAMAVSTFAAAAIGFSRLELGFHTLPEVLLGAAVGILGAAVLFRLAGPPPARRPISLLAVAGVIALLFHGTHLQAEAAISRASLVMLDLVPAYRGPAQVRP
jgi:membrane-associated phospholipid phosphatase